ncbi:MAG: Fic family protein [archaeon]
MVTVEKYCVGEREYYRLVHTIRRGGRTTHRTKYIGKVLPPEEILEQLKKEFLLEIIGQRYRYLSFDDVEGIERKKAEYRLAMEKMSLLERKEILDEFVVRFTYDSSKLSGVNVTLRQTSLILRDGIMPKSIKRLETVRVLENHRKGIMVITEYRGVLNLSFMKKLHRILMSGVWDEIAGRTRDELERDVKVAGTPYVPPKWQDVLREMDSFFKWYKDDNRKLHTLELASLVHLKIISIQPFRDGNSRLARLLMNWILWKRGYPMVDIPVEDLENYYDALDKYQIEKKDGQFVNYVKKRYLMG